MGPVLQGALEDPEWEGRQAALHRAYALIMERFNQLALVEPFSTQVTQFYDRPYAVIHAERIAEALWSTIGTLHRDIFEKIGYVGGVGQLSDNTDFLESVSHTSAYRTLFGE